MTPLSNIRSKSPEQAGLTPELAFKSPENAYFSPDCAMAQGSPNPRVFGVFAGLLPTAHSAFDRTPTFEASWSKLREVLPVPARRQLSRLAYSTPAGDSEWGR